MADVTSSNIKSKKSRYVKIWIRAEIMFVACMSVAIKLK